MKTVIRTEKINRAVRSSAEAPSVNASRPRRRRLAAPCLAVVALTLAGHSAHAANFTWTGATDATYATGTNWTPATAPGSGDTAIFSGAGNGNTTITIGTTAINTILFDTANAAAYTLGSTAGAGTITLDNLGAITMNSTVMQNELINSNLTLGTAASTFTFTNNSATNLLTLAGNVTGAASTGVKALTVAGTGSTAISGIIANGTTGTVSLTKSGSGTLTLSGANTYTGATTLNGGKLVLDGSTGSMAATPVTGNGGTFVFDNTNATGAKVQALGAVTPTSGATTISNILGGATSSRITVASQGARVLGATLNYANSGTGASIVTTTAGAFDRGVFFNGANYAVETNTGAIAAQAYTAFTTGAPAGFYTASSNAFVLASGTGYNWLVDGDSSSPNTANFGSGTIKFNGSYTLSASGSTSLGGILVAGGGAATAANFNGGAIRVSNSDIVIRTDAASDTLNLNSAINNFNSNAYTSITKSGAGTLNVNGTGNAYSGNVFVNEGTLRVLKTDSLGFGANNTTTAAVGTTTVAANARLVISGSGGAQTVNEPIALNGGSLENDSAANAVTLNNGVAGIALTTNAGISGGTTISITGGGGTGATTALSLGLTTSSLSLNGGTAYAVNDVYNVAGGGGTGGQIKVTTVDANGAITGYSINATGSGYSTAPTGLGARVSGATTGSGATLVGNNNNFTAVTFQLTNAGSGYTSTPTITSSTGTLSATATLSSVTLNGTANTIGGVGNLILNAAVANGTASGGFSKIGAGTLTLNGVNTYTGATNVMAGKLLVNGSTAAGSAVTVTNTGSLLGGTGTVAGMVSVGAGAILQGGVGTTTGTLTLSNSSPLALSSGSLIELALGATNLHSTLAFTGTTFSGFQSNQGFIFDGAVAGTYDNILTGIATTVDTSGWQVPNGGNFSYTFTNDATGNIDLSVAAVAVPEPSTWLGGVLMAGFIAWSQRRRLRQVLRAA